jgi:hypothetical protein
MNYTAQSIVEMSSLRNQLIDRVEVLSKVKALFLIPGIEMISTSMVADFYDVDIREIIDGERKSETMNSDTKDTLKKVAEYTAEEKKKLRNRMAEMMGASAILLVFCSLLFGTNGFNGFIIESAYRNIMNFTLGLTTATLVLNILFLFGIFDKIREKKLAYLNRKNKNTTDEK